MARLFSPHVILVIVCIVYIFIGALIFQSLEGQHLLVSLLFLFLFHDSPFKYNLFQEVRAENLEKIQGSSVKNVDKLMGMIDEAKERGEMDTEVGHPIDHYLFILKH